MSKNKKKTGPNTNDIHTLVLKDSHIFQLEAIDSFAVNPYTNTIVTAMGSRLKLYVLSTCTPIAENSLSQENSEDNDKNIGMLTYPFLFLSTG